MRPLLRFGRRYVLRYWPWFLAGTATIVLTNWLSVTIPLYLAQAIDVLRTGSDPMGIVGRNALLIALMGVAIMVIRTASRILFFTPGRFVESAVKTDMFARLLRQQPAFLKKWPTGDLMSRASSDVNYLRLLAGFGLLSIVNMVAVVGLTIVQMIRLSPWLTLWMVLPLAVGLGFTQLFVRVMLRLVHQMQDEIAKLSDHVLSSYQGIATVHGFVAENTFLGRFDKLNEQYRATSNRRSELRAAIGPTLAFAASIDVFVLLFVGGPMAIRGDVSVGVLVAFTALVANLVGPLRGMSFMLSIVKQGQAALERLEEVTMPEPERPDLPEPVPAPTRPPHLEIRNLSFAYPDTDRAVLHDVSIDVPAGTTLGILGPIGSGKTTLLRCIARLYNPPPGTILVDGTDLRAIDLDGWRRRLALVPQRAFLFSESLEDNVMLGVRDEAKLERVLDLAAMEVDVEALPEGVKTLVGEAGVMLSGGQRQRTALARGLVRDHVVLILDDVLSAVDHETERQLIDALRAEGVTPTTILVSHRISALQHADRIVVLRDGRVERIGTHEELILAPGLYRDTWERQREGEAE